MKLYLLYSHLTKLSPCSNVNQSLYTKMYVINELYILDTLKGVNLYLLKNNIVHYCNLYMAVYIYSHNIASFFGVRIKLRV